MVVGYLQPSHLDISRERLKARDIIAIQVQDVHTETQLVVRDFCEVALRAVSHPVDPEVVAVALVRTFQFEAVSIEGESDSESKHRESKYRDPRHCDFVSSVLDLRGHHYLKQNVLVRHSRQCRPRYSCLADLR